MKNAPDPVVVGAVNCHITICMHSIPVKVPILKAIKSSLFPSSFAFQIQDGARHQMGRRGS